MPKRSPAKVISLRGVRQNNLKGIDLDLPTGQLIVVTGLSGSGKSSLAFDTLYAEGQRRYIETFSPYARQFFDRMDKPRADSIRGIPPSVAIEQRNSVKSTRSTVGTMTEICDYMKLVWFHLSELYCGGCGRMVTKDTPQTVWESLQSLAGEEATVTFDLRLADRLSLEETLGLIGKQGYQRLLVFGGDGAEGPNEAPRVIRLDEAEGYLKATNPASVTVIQDRLRLEPGNRARFAEDCESAFHFGKGRLGVYVGAGMKRFLFSNRLHCAECDREYPERSPALFSFNHPAGACPECRGFGRIISIDMDRVIPDRSRTIAEGVIKPWQSGQSAESQEDLLRFCRKRNVPMDVPFRDLPEETQRWVIEGDPGYGKDEAHEWPRAWYGVKGYFRWLESKAYKMHVRVLLSRYRAYQTCSACGGARFRPEALRYKLRDGNGGLISLADFYRMTVRQGLEFLDRLSGPGGKHEQSRPLAIVLEEARTRVRYLNEVGLGYLTFDRPTRSLSGGETERVNLTTCLGTRLVNTLFVLDEPSVGLHPRDTERLVRILERLRDAQNTVVVVEHERGIMQAADRIIDLGPGHGDSGGEVVFEGPYSKILRSARSLTGRYLSGKMRIEVPARRPVSPSHPSLVLAGARQHNLKDLTVRIPLNRFVCVTGVSGSGKTTLVREVLLPALERALRMDRRVEEEEEPEETESAEREAGGSAAAGVRLSGHDRIGQVILVDQSPIGKTPRSNPAVYIGAFDAVRDLFAESEPAKQRGLSASAFSFNSAQGRCERCAGAGFERIEMQFLSDVFIRCPECDGRRYRPHILEIELSAPEAEPRSKGRAGRNGAGARKGWNIADLLEATADEAILFLRKLPQSRAAQAALGRLHVLQQVGLGYLQLGRPINTLSGGECQRLKLVRHLVEASPKAARESRSTLFLFDEPTTGLHFHDVKILIQVFQGLVDQGHSIVVIEHHSDLIKSSDWIIDLGPEAGEEGGRIVAEGTPEAVAANPDSHTGRALGAAGVEALPHQAAG